MNDMNKQAAGGAVAGKAAGKAAGAGAKAAAKAIAKWINTHGKIDTLALGGGAALLLTKLFPKQVGHGVEFVTETVPKTFGLAKDKTEDLYNNLNDLAKTMKNQAIGTDSSGYGLRTVAGPNGSVSSLFNPFSGLTGTVDYVPGKWIDAVQKVIPGEAGKTTAHMTAKAGAMMLLAAGLVGGYRTLRHVGDIVNMDKATRPGKNMASQLSTTFEGDLSGEDKKQKKAASEDNSAPPGKYDIRNPGNFTPWMLSATALPLGTFLLASALAYKGVDSVFDKFRNKRLDRSIKEKEQAVKKLITARAQQAKGGVTSGTADAATEDLRDSDIYTKSASQNKIAIIPETVQLVGVSSAAILLASAIGAYHYTASADENNIKYKAYKKALKEYAKAKSGMTPITVAPTNSADYFAGIDAAAGNRPVTPRSQPAYDSDALNKPISVSF